MSMITRAVKCCFHQGE